MIAKRGQPEAIAVDNGTEFRGRALAGWSGERRVRLQHIEPGKPVQNGYIESFTGRLPRTVAKRELVFEPGRFAEKDRSLEAGLQRRAIAQLVGIYAVAPIRIDRLGRNRAMSKDFWSAEQGKRASGAGPLCPAPIPVRGH